MPPSSARQVSSRPAPPPPASTPLRWEDWRGTRHRHSGANDPGVRAAEPPAPDVSGEKYLVVGGGPSTGALPLVCALERLVDRGDPRDRIVVAGSHRPVVAWRAVSRGHVPRLDYVGASAAEARAAEESGLLRESDGDHVILRIRMTRRTLDRIKAASEHVRVEECDPEGRRGKFMSTWALAVILDALEVLDRRIEAIRAAGFTGTVPP